MDLSTVKTGELIKELRMREAVDVVRIEPGKSITIKAENPKYGAIVIVVPVVQPVIN